MSRRKRRIAGLLLFFTMTVSLAESVWAATCDAASFAPAGATADRMEMAESMPEMAMPPMDPTDRNPHDCAPGYSHDSTPQRDNETSCPFAPAGATQGCAASALLPAASTSVGLTPHEGTNITVAVESTPRSTSAASIFHPPRA